MTDALLVTSSKQAVHDGQNVLLEAQGLRYRYPGAQQSGAFELVVEELAVHAGEVLALCGPSGSGKSTLLSILAGMLRPISGQVLLVTRDGKRDLYAGDKQQRRARRREIGIVYQDPRESLNDRRTVLDIVMDPLRIHGLPAEVPRPSGLVDRLARSLHLAGPAVRRARRAAALQSLAQVGISTSQAMRPPDRLSGGQRQRVSMARALVAGARLLFLDEPTSALDVSVQATVVNLLATLHQQNRQSGHVLVTHDLALARQLADRIAVFDQGNLVELGTTDQVLEAPASSMAQRLLKEGRAVRTRDMGDRD